MERLGQAKRRRAEQCTGVANVMAGALNRFVKFELDANAEREVLCNGRVSQRHSVYRLYACPHDWSNNKRVRVRQSERCAFDQCPVGLQRRSNDNECRGEMAR